MRVLFRNPFFILTLVALLWGGNAVAGKIAAGHVSPMLLTSLRWFFACIFIAPFAWQDVRREWTMICQHWVTLFLFAALGFTAFNALFYWALNYTSAINVTIEQSGMPLVVFLGNFLLFGLRPVKLQLLGFSLTLLGVIITVAHGDISSLMSLDLNRGDALMLLATLLYGGYTVALRFRPPLHWRSMILILAMFALLSSLPLSMYEYYAGHTILPDAKSLVVVLYIAIFPSLIAQSLYMRGVDLIGGNRANLFINLVPVFGSALAVVILAEDFQTYHFIALILVVGGIMLAEQGVKKLT
ncbi:DMT family transporter [Zhongshania sp. BJYM1]|uniref:DMT family transporter n=1 Tax=Zhongshania aquatica TaxID=2965069 RepID=UPI0022B360F7|nr:DMT family transporter [Marortus sp. BJYM1]